MRGAHAARHWLDGRALIGAAALLVVVAGAAAGVVHVASGSTDPAGAQAALVGQAPTPVPSRAGAAADTWPGTPTAPGTSPIATRPEASAHPSPSGARPSRSPTPSPTKPTKTALPPIVAGTVAQREQVLTLTNEQRADNGGLDALRMNTKLQAAAQAYAAHLAADGQFSHTDGSQLGDRVTVAGYRWSGVGENLGLGQRTPAEIVAAWMASPGHRANMLNPKFVDVGVGIATRPDGQIVWCMDLGTPG